MEDYYIPAVTDSEFLGQMRVRFPHALQQILPRLTRTIG